MSHIGTKRIINASVIYTYTRVRKQKTLKWKHFLPANNFETINTQSFTLVHRLFQSKRISCAFLERSAGKFEITFVYTCSKLGNKFSYKMRDSLKNHMRVALSRSLFSDFIGFYIAVTERAQR